MKYLSHYTQHRMSKLFEDNGAFFAFSDSRFEEQRNKDIPRSEYCSMLGGLCVPKANSKAVLLGVAEITKSGIDEDIKENGIVGIIKRELNNHEAYYTGDISSTVDALKAYGLTAEQIMKVFRNKNTTEEELYKK